MTIISVGDKMVDKYGVEVEIVGFTHDYAGIEMIRCKEVLTEEWFHEQIHGVLGQQVGDVLFGSYYHSELRPVER